MAPTVCRTLLIAEIEKKIECRNNIQKPYNWTFLTPLSLSQSLTSFSLYSPLHQLGVAMALSLQRYTWSEPDSALNCFLKQRIQKQRETSVVVAVKLGDALPETLIVEILSWLPVKALLQFKSVCKSWYAIISSRDFISKHIQHYYNHNNESDCLLTQYYVSHAELQLYELLLDETPKVLAHEILYAMPMYGSYICGPCHGIYYLYNYESSDRALWNPAINELKTLPPIAEKPNLPSNLTCAKSEVYGFGYDPSTEDYKVVVIKGYWPADDSDVTHPSSVLIYSFKADSWRYWGDLAQDYELDSNKCYIYVNGCCYWRGSCEQYENSEVIISFDLIAETYHEIQVPNYEQPASKNLGVYHDTIAFLCVHENNFDIWTFNDGLWTKKFTMGPIPELRNPIGHWKNNEFLLDYEDGKVALCDTSTQEIRDIGYEQQRWCEGAYVYKESLVSFKGCKNNEGTIKELE